MHFIFQILTITKSLQNPGLGICKKKILHLNIFLQLGISTKIILSLGLVNFEILTWPKKSWASVNLKLAGKYDWIAILTNPGWLFAKLALEI